MEPLVHDAVFDMRMARDQFIAALGGIGEADWSRFVPYGSRTLHDLLAHVAASDQVWAVTAQGLLKGEAVQKPPLTPEDARSARQRALERGRSSSAAELTVEMEQRRRLLLALFELLESRHLSLRLPSFGDEHNAVRERMWLGYHDRLHADDVRRAMATRWHPPTLSFLPEIEEAFRTLAPDETLYVVYSVDPVYWERPSVRDRAWTFRQVLTHIATGDWVFQGHLRHIIEHGRVGEPPNVIRSSKDVAGGNATLIAERSRTNERTLIDEYVSMRHETMLLLSQIKPSHLSLPFDFWWEPERAPHTVLDYIRAFPTHDAGHRDQLRPAMRHATNPRA